MPWYAKWIWLLGMLCGTAVIAMSQCPTMPAGTFCLTQAQANAARDAVQERDGLKEKVVVLEAGLAEKDKIAAAARADDLKSINELKAQNTDLAVKLGTATGQIIECRADKVMYTSLIEYLTKNQKSKQNGLINIKLGGN